MDNIRIFPGGKGPEAPKTGEESPNLNYVFQRIDGTEEFAEGYMIVTESFVGVSDVDDGYINFLMPVDQLQQVVRVEPDDE